MQCIKTLEKIHEEKSQISLVGKDDSGRDGSGQRIFVSANMEKILTRAQEITEFLSELIWRIPRAVPDHQ